MAVNTPTAPEQLRQEAAKVAAPEAPQRETLARRMEGAARDGQRRLALEVAKDNLSMGVDSDRLKRNGDNNFKHTDATIRTGDIQQFVNDGERTSNYLRGNYDRLSQTDKRRLHEQITTELQSTAFLSELNASFSTPAERVAFAEQLMQDPDFKLRANRRLHVVSTRQLTEAKKQERLTQMQNPESPYYKEGATIEDAAGQLETELKNDMANVIRDAFRETIRDNLDSADKLVTDHGEEIDAETAQRMQEQGKTAGDGVMRALEKKWAEKNAYAKKGYFNKEGGVIMQDYDKFITGGLDAIFQPPSDETNAILADPELRKKYEEQIGQSLITKRLRMGGLSEGDLHRVVDAQWMGATQGERIAKLGEIIANHNAVQNLLASGEQDGWIKDKSGFINALKDPKNAGGLLGILAALLAALAVGPLAAGAVIPVAAAKAGLVGLAGVAGVTAGAGISKNYTEHNE